MGADKYQKEKKKKKWTKAEIRKLYETDPLLWLKLFSKGKYGKSLKKEKE